MNHRSVEDRTQGNQAAERYAALLEEHRMYEERLNRALTHKDAFSEKVLAKVTGEYRSKLEQVSRERSLLETQLGSELAAFEKQLQALLPLRQRFHEELEELELRHLTGEIGTKEYTKRKAALESQKPAGLATMDVLQSNIVFYHGVLEGSAAKATDWGAVTGQQVSAEPEPQFDDTAEDADNAERTQAAEPLTYAGAETEDEPWIDAVSETAGLETDVAEEAAAGIGEDWEQPSEGGGWVQDEAEEGWAEGEAGGGWVEEAAEAWTEPEAAAWAETEGAGWAEGEAGGWAEADTDADSFAGTEARELAEEVDPELQAEEQYFADQMAEEELEPVEEAYAAAEQEEELEPVGYFNGPEAAASGPEVQEEEDFFQNEFAEAEEPDSNLEWYSAPVASTDAGYDPEPAGQELDQALEDLDEFADDEALVEDEVEIPEELLLDEEEDYLEEGAEEDSAALLQSTDRLLDEEAFDEVFGEDVAEIDAENRTLEPALVLRDGMPDEKIFYMTNNVLSIGRGPDNDIQLSTDTSVSRHHSRITYEDDEYWIADLGSSNGTIVNGARVSKTVLTGEDEISIGQTVLKFKFC